MKKTTLVITLALLSATLMLSGCKCPGWCKKNCDKSSPAEASKTEAKK